MNPSKLTPEEYEQWWTYGFVEPCETHEDIIEEVEDCEFYVIKRHRCSHCDSVIDITVEIPRKTMELLDGDDCVLLDLSSEIDCIVMEYVGDAMERKGSYWHGMFMTEEWAREHPLPEDIEE